MDVVTRFRDLRAHERIAVMCDLFNCCTTIELHFFTTYLKSHPVVIEPFEITQKQAKDVEFDAKCSVFDSVNRKVLIATVALLTAEDCKCATSVYDIVKADLTVDSNWHLLPLDSSETMEEIFLLVTLILHHPAFKYAQFHKFFDLLVKLKELCPTSDGKTLQDEKISVDRGTKVSEKVSAPDNESALNQVLPDKSCCSSLTVVSPKNNRGRILGIKCRKISRMKVSLTVTDASLNETTVVKEFHEINDFHKKLLNLHPNEDSFRNATNILERKKDQTKDVEECFTFCLNQMPASIKYSDLVIDFITNKCKPPNLVGTSKSSLNENNVAFMTSSKSSKDSRKSDATFESLSNHSSRSRDYTVVNSNRKSLSANNVGGAFISDKKNRMYMESLLPSNVSHSSGVRNRNHNRNNAKVIVTQFPQLPEVKVVIKGPENGKVPSAFPAIDQIEKKIQSKHDVQSVSAHQFPQNGQSSKDQSIKAKWVQNKWKEYSPITVKDTKLRYGAEEFKSKSIDNQSVRSLDLTPVPIAAEMCLNASYPQSYSQMLNGCHLQNDIYGHGVQNDIYWQSVQNGIYGQGVQNGIYGQGVQNGIYGQGVQNGIYGQGVQDGIYGQGVQDGIYGQGVQDGFVGHGVQDGFVGQVQNSSEGQAVSNCYSGKSIENGSRGIPSNNRQSTTNSIDGQGTMNTINKHGTRNSADECNTTNGINGQDAIKSCDGQGTKNSISQGIKSNTPQVKKKSDVDGQSIDSGIYEQSPKSDFNGKGTRSGQCIKDSSNGQAIKNDSNWQDAKSSISGQCAKTVFLRQCEKRLSHKQSSIKSSKNVEHGENLRMNGNHIPHRSQSDHIAHRSQSDHLPFNAGPAFSPKVNSFRKP